MQPNEPQRIAVMAIALARLELLLVPHAQCAEQQPGEFALPSGSLLSDDQAGQAVRQCVREEAAVSVLTRIECLGTFGIPGSGTQCLAFLAFVESEAAPAQGEEVSGPLRAQWWKITSLPELACDHGSIVGYGIKRLRFMLAHTPHVLSLLPAQLSLGDVGSLLEELRRADKPTRHL